MECFATQTVTGSSHLKIPSLDLSAKGKAHFVLFCFFEFILMVINCNV